MAVAGIIIIAVVVGVVLASNHNKKSNSNLSSSSGTTGASANATVQQTDPNDPSKFTQDPTLHQSFYGLAYTPVGSQLPDCGNSLGRSRTDQHFKQLADHYTALQPRSFKIYRCVMSIHLECGFRYLPCRINLDNVAADSCNY